MRTRNYQSFEDFLKENRLVETKLVNYYVNWVKQFSSFAKNKISRVNRDTITEFIDYLGTKSKIQEWQIKQADNALSIYCSSYLKQIHNIDIYANFRKTKIPIHPGTGSLNMITEEITNYMYKRRYARTTIKTYTGWIRAFFEYLNYKAPINICSQDAKNFLTHLAVKKK